MQYIFNGLDLGYENFRLKFYNTCIIIQTESFGNKPTPVLVSDVRPGDCLVYAAGSGIPKKVTKDIIIKKNIPDKIGYINTDKRKPTHASLNGERQQKQGLCIDRLSFNDGRVESMFQLLALYGEFPSLQEAMTLILKGEKDTVALSPNFCITKSWDIYFRLKRVGHVSANIVFHDDELMELFKGEVKYD